MNENENINEINMTGEAVEAAETIATAEAVEGDETAEIIETIEAVETDEMDDDTAAEALAFDNDDTEERIVVKELAETDVPAAPAELPGLASESSEVSDKVGYKHSRKKRIKDGGVFPKRIPYAILVLLMGLASIALLGTLIISDLLPSELMGILIGSVVGLLLLASVLMARRRRWKRIIGMILALAFLVSVGGLAYYLGETYAMMNKISEDDKFSNAEKKTTASVDPTSEPFNLYITGIDRWAGEQDLDRSDVNMIMTINPVTKKIMLTSIPRDSYVKLHTAQQMDKLTHTGIYGVDETINTVQDWLGVDLDYYVKLNFSAMRGIINAIGGIDVYSPVAFDSDISEFSYEKGWNHLNGKQALYFARERHAFEGQDSVRVENQQRVVKAIIKKMTSSTTLMTRYGDIMSVAGSNLSTNMSYAEIQSLIKMQMSDLASWDVDTQKIEGEYGMDYVASLSSKRMYSVYLTDQVSVEACLKGIDRIMNPTEEELEAAKEDSTKTFMENLVERLSEKAESVKNRGKDKDTEKDKDK